jgi:FlaA1/EpsC-like NDP-sugar epimerase
MRNRYILLGDLPLIVAAASGAFALRFDLLFPGQRPEFLLFALAAVLVKPLIFYVFGMYGRYWRYASAQDLVAVTLAVSASSMAMAVLVVLGSAANLVHNFSREVILIDWLLTLATVGGLRMSVRVVGDAKDRAHKGNGNAAPKRVLVAGAGEAGALVVVEMQKNPQLGLVPVGFLDDSPVKRGKLVHGVRVLGPLAALAEVVRTEGVAEVVIAMPTAPGTTVRAVAENCREVRVASRTLPGVFELLDGHVSVSRLRNVDITDLLRRSQVSSTGNPASYIAGRTVLITGAGGSIGSELCRQVAAARPSALVLLGHGEHSIFEISSRLREQAPSLPVRSVVGDIRDRQRLELVFDRFDPHIVFHTAAHKHVPLMEANPAEAITNNVLGTHNLVQTALRGTVERLVLISSDKAVSPTSVMGASKRLAEMIVQDAARRNSRAFTVVRFGNVLGSRGSVVPLFKRQIEAGGPITITDPAVKRYFMSMPEAVQLVLQAGGMGSGGELFVLNMGEQVRIVDLANDLIRLSGMGPDEVSIIFTGLRPGEKLEEALWEDGASVDRTANADIFRVSGEAGDPAEPLEMILPELATAAEEGDPKKIRAVLQRWIPTFNGTVRDRRQSAVREKG